MRCRANASFFWLTYGRHDQDDPASIRKRTTRGEKKADAKVKALVINPTMS
jgi:hypothetical protein